MDPLDKEESTVVPKQAKKILALEEFAPFKKNESSHSDVKNGNSHTIDDESDLLGEGDKEDKEVSSQKDQA